MCIKCGATDALEKGRRVCKACMKAVRKAINQKRIAERYEYVNQIKDVPCADCGGRFPSMCMDFDHLPGYEKKFEISTQIGKSMDFDLILAEIEKCEVVCANCHRIRTFTRRAV